MKLCTTHHWQGLLFAGILKVKIEHFKQDLGSAPPGTGSPEPFGPRTPEESEKSPESPPGGTPRVPEECAPESQKSPKRVESQVLDSSRTLLRLRGALFGDPGGPVPGTLSGLFSDSSGVPGPKGPGDPVPGGADPKARLAFFSRCGPLGNKKSA